MLINSVDLYLRHDPNYKDYKKYQSRILMCLNKYNKELSHKCFIEFAMIENQTIRDNKRCNRVILEKIREELINTIQSEISFEKEE